MLVLTRKTGQVIRIGDSVTVTVVQLSRGRVRIGIDAPHAVPVHRGEIHDQIRQAIAEECTHSLPEATARPSATPVGCEA